MNETPKELDAAVKLVLEYKRPKHRTEQSAEVANTDGPGELECKSKLGDVGQFAVGMVNKILTMLGVLSVVLLFVD